MFGRRFWNFYPRAVRKPDFSDDHSGRPGNTGPFASTWSWGVGVILGLTVCTAISGGHINPAVTFAFASVGKLPWKKVPWYFLGQYLGGFFASVFVFVTYYDALNSYDPDRRVIGEFRTADFCNLPKDDISIWNCFVGEVVAGFLVMFSIMAIVDKKNLNIPTHLHPLFVGLTIQTTLLAFGLNCMAPLNPARDFAPRVFASIAGWGNSTFSIRNYGYFWIGILGPHIGCILGAWVYYLAIELQLQENREESSVDEQTLELKAGI